MERSCNNCRHLNEDTCSNFSIYQHRVPFSPETGNNWCADWEDKYYYVYESRYSNSGRLANFSVIPEFEYRKKIAKDVFQGPFPYDKAKQILTALQNEERSQLK